MAAHDRLFPLSDHLKSLMFLVASDLSEAQRVRLMNALSLQKMDVTAYTFEAVRKVFVRLFCSPKSSIENPSLRVNQYGNHTSSTFIVEDLMEYEFGQRATDEVTGEQGYVDDEGSCFWTWDNNKYAWQSRPFRCRIFFLRKAKENTRLTFLVFIHYTD